MKMRKDLQTMNTEIDTMQTEAEALQAKAEELKRINMAHYESATGFKTTFEKYEYLLRDKKSSDEHAQNLLRNMTLLDGEKN
jgi:hypothetical protein